MINLVKLLLQVQFYNGKPMKEILEKYGWSMYHSCNCGGVYKEYFSHPNFAGYKIIIKPRRNRFLTKKLNQTVKDANNYQLEDYLKTLIK